MMLMWNTEDKCALTRSNTLSYQTLNVFTINLKKAFWSFFVIPLLKKEMILAHPSDHD